MEQHNQQIAEEADGVNLFGVAAVKLNLLGGGDLSFIKKVYHNPQTAVHSRNVCRRSVATSDSSPWAKAAASPASAWW